MPTYPAEHDIVTTMEAVPGRDHPHNEVMVVDDASAPTLAIVRQNAAQGVRLIHPGGGGRLQPDSKLAIRDGE